jgi:hypothetical protein
MRIEAAMVSGTAAVIEKTGRDPPKICSKIAARFFTPAPQFGVRFGVRWRAILSAKGEIRGAASGPNQRGDYDLRA